MIYCGETLGDPELVTKVDELLTAELSPVVCNYLLRNTEPADDITPHKLDDLRCRNVS